MNEKLLREKFGGKAEAVMEFISAAEDIILNAEPFVIWDVQADAKQVWARGYPSGREDEDAMLHYVGPRIGVKGELSGGRRADPEHLADLRPIMKPAAAAARKAGCILWAYFTKEGILNWVSAGRQVAVINTKTSQNEEDPNLE